MPEDRSLDEFGGVDADGADGEATADADGAGSSSEPADAPDDIPAVDDPTPATATATWTAGGADCERCSERAERRWLDDGDRVCPDCKSW
ncbi:DUF7573 domain-containing protein [Halorubrum lipolyticum]|uniref:DUF7573 domain-containing protein n=1 Tax=Halorubrum lipolyticum DSM 21995 TaxID=1227482 RepID=M0NIK8_9EURY|nr:hypothetical protein [Halorubrum lipolyticum]EMA57812.1 hypothetical protein C469_14411 [Halorubrum lipolyticum DSM 21995]